MDTDGQSALLEPVLLENVSADAEPAASSPHKHNLSVPTVPSVETILDEPVLLQPLQPSAPGPDTLPSGKSRRAQTYLLFVLFFHRLTEPSLTKICISVCASL